MKYYFLIINLLPMEGLQEPENFTVIPEKFTSQNFQFKIIFNLKNFRV